MADDATRRGNNRENLQENDESTTTRTDAADERLSPPEAARAANDERGMTTPRRGNPGQNAPDVARPDSGEERRNATYVRTGEIPGSAEGAGLRGPDADSGEFQTPRQPAPQLGPVGGTPEIADPNFPVDHPEVGQAGKAGQASASLDDLQSRGVTNHRRARLVKDLMSPAVEVCTLTTELYYVALMMADRDVGAIPVVASTEEMRPVVGIISDRDIVVRVIAKREDPHALRAGDCMTANVLTVTPQTSLQECLVRMERRQVRRVVVVDDEGHCVGVVAQADLARLLPRENVGELVRDVSELRD